MSDYYMINSRWEIKSAPAVGPKYKQRKAVGNYFKTIEEAEAFLDAIKRIKIDKRVEYRARLLDNDPKSVARRLFGPQDEE